MSEQSRKPENETQGSEPWERKADKKKVPLTPEQARKKREKRIMIGMIVLAVVMVATTAVVLFYNRWVKRPELPPPPGPTQTVDPMQSLPPDTTPEPTLNIDAIEPKVSGERKSDAIYTILIFGQDTTSGLTDTMMVATYDVTNQRATVMSLPRDTLINSSARPNINAKKLNAVYNVYGQGDEGIEALKNEVSELVGFVPDYYVQIDWELVGEMVDAIGGVWFDNPYHMEYYDPYQNLNIYQEKGYRLLNGDDAMQVVRWRHSVNGAAISDIQRLNIQHDFLKAVLEQTLQIKNITRIGQLIELFNSRVKSDLAVENMLWFAQEAVLGGLKVSDVEFCTMPNVSGSYYQFGQDWSFVYPVQSKLLTLINESLNPFQEEVTIRQLDLMSVAGDGSLRSSTGRLAAPELGQPPVRETDEPVESDPVEPDPVETDPAESQPVESQPGQDEPPVESVPGQEDPDPVQTEGQPPEGRQDDPEVTMDPGGEGPDQGEADPGPAADQPEGDEGVTDWGYTPD